MRTVLFALLSSLSAQIAVATPPPSSCVMFEAEVFSVALDGELHPLFNFGQSLPSGKPWQFKLSEEGLDLAITVTWEKSLDGWSPILELRLSPTPADPSDETPMPTGKVRLQRLVWDTLLGPEGFALGGGAPFILPELGRPVAVVAANQVSCE